MRVAVTGAGGFLGTYVSDEVQKRDHSAVLARGHADFNLMQLWDARDLLRGCDAVIHVAAKVGGIGANKAQPGAFYYQNAQMGLNVIEAARLEHVRKVVVIGTACEYPDNAMLPLEERDLWRGYPIEVTAPYAMAKKGLIVMGDAYRIQYDMTVEHVIPTNLYGPNDNFNPETGHVIPAMIVKCHNAAHANRGTVEFWGTGTPTRDFLHVEDAARGIVDVLEHEQPLFGPVNLGSGVETPIGVVGQYLADLYNLKITWDTLKPDGVARRILSIDRARDWLGWEPEIKLADGLHETVEWYEEVYK